VYQNIQIVENTSSSSDSSFRFLCFLCFLFFLLFFCFFSLFSFFFFFFSCSLLTSDSWVSSSLSGLRLGGLTFEDLIHKTRDESFCTSTSHEPIMYLEVSSDFSIKEVLLLCFESSPWATSRPFDAIGTVRFLSDESSCNYFSVWLYFN